MERFRSEPPASTHPANKHGKVDRHTRAEAFFDLREALASRTKPALEQMEEACHT